MVKRTINKMLIFILAIVALTCLPFQSMAADVCHTSIEVTTNGQMDIAISSPASSPLPANSVITVNGTGSFALSFDEPGDYTYEISQVIGSDPKVTYDTTVYEVYCSVMYNDADQLVCYVTSKIKGTTVKPDKLSFKNKGESSIISTPTPTPTKKGEAGPTGKDSTPADPNVTKGADAVDTGDSSPIFMYSFLILISIAAIVIAIKKSVSEK